MCKSIVLVSVSSVVSNDKESALAEPTHPNFSASASIPPVVLPGNKTGKVVD